MLVPSASCHLIAGAYKVPLDQLEFDFNCKPMPPAPARNVPMPLAVTLPIFVRLRLESSTVVVPILSCAAFVKPKVSSVVITLTNVVVAERIGAA